VNDLCPTCHGVHRGLPECVGRPQTDAEWMRDRGVSEERIATILAARERIAAVGSPLPAMARPQETLF
jgi:hypothetical protein